MVTVKAGIIGVDGLSGVEVSARIEKESRVVKKNNPVKADMDNDVYFKKIIPFKYGNKELQFKVAQDLFSSYQIDLGTQFLLRTIALDGTFHPGKVLDLGCGYGPIGIALKSLVATSTVHMVDKDALAVAYSRKNIELNRLTGIDVTGSLDYDSVTDGDYDLIASNIPAKAGEPVIAHLLEDAFYHLSPQGTAAVVVVSLIEPVTAEILGKNPNIEIIQHKGRPGHAVFQYQFRQHHSQTIRTVPDTNNKDVYFKELTKLSFGNRQYNVETAWGLPTFNESGLPVELLIDGLENSGVQGIKNIMLLNSGNGYLPIIAAALFNPQRIILSDRDLLSLRYSKKNLIANGIPEANLAVAHRVGPDNDEPTKIDLAVCPLKEDEGPGAAALLINRLGDLMSPGGIVLLSGSSTAITRLTGTVPENHFRVLKREKKKGFSLLVLKSRNAV